MTPDCLSPDRCCHRRLAPPLVHASLGRHRLDLRPGAPLAAEGPRRRPVTLLSHGLGGLRSMHSLAAGELASQGYVVLAVEHAEGTASCCQLATGACRFFAGLGGVEGQHRHLRDRVKELQTAGRVLSAMDAGQALPGLALTGGLDPALFLAGGLDLCCFAAMGHSYGGATVAALVAEEPSWACGVALDPWWYALPPQSAALRGWHTTAPLLVQASEAWATPDAAGRLGCCGARQAAVLGAAARGGGALRLVLARFLHASFADPPALNAASLGRLAGLGPLRSRLDPALGLRCSVTATLAFLETHLPLSEAQRAVQTWRRTLAPVRLQQAGEAAGESGAAVGADDAEPRHGRGRCWLVGERRCAGCSVTPLRLGALEAMADWLVNRSLSMYATLSEFAPPPGAEADHAGGSPTPPARTVRPGEVADLRALLGEGSVIATECY
eukprot:scaffold3.g6542.t1